MLVFSGDSDGVCATVGTQNWVFDIENAGIIDLHKSWKYVDPKYGEQQGGYVSRFSGYYSFATVHWAGHEVPGYRPVSSFQLFKSYLNGDLFRR